MSWKERAQVVSDQPQGSWRERAEEIKTPQVIEEMHPDLKLSDRLIVKNFAQSPEKAIAYLKQQYPTHQFELGSNGKYLMRKQGETDSHVVDPDTGFFSKDFLYDAGDVGWDTLQGGAESLAGYAGGLIGGVAALPAAPLTAGASIPAGVLGGAALASAPVGYAGEGLRQKLGSALGIPQEVDHNDMLISGGTAGIAPLLFGAGKAKGAIGAGWDYTKGTILPKIGSAMSGVTPDALKNYANKSIRSTVDGLEKTGVSEYAGDIYDRLSGYVTGNRQRAGQQLADVIDQSGKQVNIAPAKGAFKGSQSQILEDALLTNNDQSKADALLDTFQQYFGRNNKGYGGEGVVDNFVEIPDLIPANKAWGIQKDLQQVAKYGEGMTPADMHMKGTARNSYDLINKGLDEASEGLSTPAKKQYQSALELEQSLLPKFEGPTRADSIQKTFNVMSNTDKNSRKVMAEQLQSLADDGVLDLTNEAQVLGAFKELGNPNLMPMSRGGTTSTSRTIPLATLGALGGGYAGSYSGVTDNQSVNKYGGALLGAGLASMLGSPAAMKNYIRASSKAGDFKKFLAPTDDAKRRAARNFWTLDLLKQENEDQ